MARQKDIVWNAGEHATTTHEQARLAVLMDIRDELKLLNSIMYCPNVIGGFRALQRIDKRLAKKVKLP